MKFAVLSLSITFTSVFCLPSHSQFRRGHAQAIQHNREARALAKSTDAGIPNSNLFFIRRSLSPFTEPAPDIPRILLARSDDQEGEDESGDDEGENDEGEEEDCKDEEEEDGEENGDSEAPTNNVTFSASQKPGGKDKDSYTKPVGDKKDSYTKPSDDKKNSSYANHGDDKKDSPYTKPAVTKPDVKKDSYTKPAEDKKESYTMPVENKPVEKPVEHKPVEQPAENKPTEKPVETKPVETKPVETKPVKTKPVETKPVETKPVETKPVETKPVETKSVETKPAYTPPTPKQGQTSPPRTDKDDSYTEGDYTKGGGGGNVEEHTGKATFYEQGGAAGSCGTVHSDADFVVAIDIALYGGGKYCGKKIAVTRVSTGKTIECIAADLCPGCPSIGSLDLSEAAFNALGNPDEGVFAIDWKLMD